MVGELRLRVDYIVRSVSLNLSAKWGQPYFEPINAN